ncbi:hypothetical protein SKAU_G00065150 [Synaphobranchus kaupii]|uniref:Uncharacterized protein n=1 Tax=Synaphobranchus kaupii TaxID=118154 RepID=A0A9Q1G766_SYNKA|nr:hypothetical protein SKAU_G00065150 [Synaphobranchus kaupii]
MHSMYLGPRPQPRSYIKFAGQQRLSSATRERKCGRKNVRGRGNIGADPGSGLRTRGLGSESLRGPRDEPILKRQSEMEGFAQNGGPVSLATTTSCSRSTPGSTGPAHMSQTPDEGQRRPILRKYPDKKTKGP